MQPLVSTVQTGLAVFVQTRLRMGRSGPMSFLGRTVALLREIGTSAQGMVSAAPPYRRIEGSLVAKEAMANGRFFILVDAEIVEVDWLTYETLIEGEALRIRATRDNRALSIDRLLP